MKQSLIISLATVLLFVTAHRLPAPITEVPESPTPAPAVAPAATPQSKPKPKPKPEASESTKNAVKQQPAPRQTRFAGTWVGTMPTIPWGNLPSVVMIDSTETAMAMSWYEADKAGNGKIHQHFKAAPESARGQIAANPAFAQARIEGATIIAAFPADLLGKSKWSLTPQPDGMTAKVRMQAFMNDYTAVFQKRSSSTVTMTSPATPPAAPVARSEQTGPPTAKPVPDKPGFVYDPFDPNSKVLLDVRGKASGAKVKDPSGRLFIVP
jgi:hypothetical protein